MFSMLRHFFFIVLIFFIGSVSYGQNTVRPSLSFDSPEALMYEPDLRLALGIEGSIELQLSLPQEFPHRSALYSIVQHGNAKDKEQFSISVAGTRRQIIFSNGKKSAAWQCDFTDNKAHQMVFTTSNGKTSFFFDGKPGRISPFHASGFTRSSDKKTTISQSSTANGKSGQPTPRYQTVKTDKTGVTNTVANPTGIESPAGIEHTSGSKHPFTEQIGYSQENILDDGLVIGNTGTRSGFTGTLTSFTIWNRALNEERIRRLATHPADVEEDTTGLYDNLIGYLDITDSSAGFYFTSPEYFTTDFAGMPTGDYYYSPNEGSHQSSSYDIRYIIKKEHDHKISNFLPVVLKKEDYQVSDTTIGYIHLPFSGELLGMQNLTEYPLLTGNAGVILKEFPLEGKGIIDLRNGNAIRRMFGTYSSTGIASLSFVTKDHQTIAVQTMRESGDALQPFCIDLPQHSTFKGFMTRQTSEALTSIAMVYSFDSPDDDAIIMQRLYTSGRWIGFSDPKAQRDSREDIDNNSHGNYTTTPVYSIKEVTEDSVYVVYKDMGKDALIKTFQMTTSQIGAFIKTPLSATSTSFTGSGWGESAGGGNILNSEEGIIVSGSTGSFLTADFPKRFVRPQRYSDPYPDKIAWGGTFNQDQRPALSRGNFVGYNIFTMDPRDFQKDVYTQKYIFKYPEEDSYDYYTTDNRISVPYGLLYRNDNVGVEKMKSETFFSRNEHTKSWSMHLGVNAGVEGICSFSENVSYENEMSTMESKGSSITTAKTVEGRYALVLDKSRITLSDEFTSYVYGLRNAKLNGLAPNYNQFVREFGTHYAYAVTYGGCAYLEIVKKEQSTSKTEKSKIAIEAAASASIEGISFGGSGGYSQGFSDQFQNDHSVEEINFGTIGGSISRGQGWSLSKGDEVPIYLDLRPISELFSPTFFDDPIIWTQLRSELWNIIERRADSLYQIQSHRIGPVSHNITDAPEVQECGCSPNTFRNVSDHSWVEFRLPTGKPNDVISIPKGTYYHYASWKCNRVHWSALRFTCQKTANSCRWVKTSGDWDADGNCFLDDLPDSPYVFWGNK